MAASPALAFQHYERTRGQGYQSIDLTPQQTRDWTVTKAAFFQHCPAFAHLFITMLNPRDDLGLATFVTVLPDGRELPCAATDGVALLINPETFFALPVAQRVFVLAHEVLHNLFDHIGQAWRMSKRGAVLYPDGTRLPFDDTKMNEAEDYVINAILVESKIGEMNPAWLLSKSVPHTMTAIDAYRLLWQSPPPKDDQPRSGKKPQPKRFDLHLPPGAGSKAKPNPDEVARDRNESEWKTQTAAALRAAQAMGKMPAGLARMFEDMIAPNIAWRDHIRGFLARRSGGGGYDWHRPDRRFITRDPRIVVPGRSGHGCGDLVVAADTSGSIGKRTLDMFMGAAAEILIDLRPRRIHLLWCDAVVHDADECEGPDDLNTIRRRGVKGGGGTSFIPVFDWVARHDIRPDALIYLTDGEGRFPHTTPNYPVLWASIKISPEQYPFGEVVMIPRQI